MTDSGRPLQVIWAGKPYPKDYGAIGVFNSLIEQTKNFNTCAVLTGYELDLSAALKKGSDLWLNTPRFPREASGTSGMTAAMNGSISLSIPDGWIPEFARHGENSFLLPLADLHAADNVKDDFEANGVLDVLENEIIPLYYDSAREVPGHPQSRHARGGARVRVGPHGHRVLPAHVRREVGSL